MRARAAVFDLYGDHLAESGYWAPIAAVVALTDRCGSRPPATRTAVSRMVAQDWLGADRRHGVRGYAATTAGRERLRRAWHRIYDPGAASWDGQWHLVVVEPPDERVARARLQSSMTYLGYGRLAPASWVGPHRNTELPGVLRSLGVRSTDILGGSQRNPVELVQQVWDLGDLATAYRDFIRTVPDRALAAQLSPREAYPVRTQLVHRWRNFMFRDPGLPAEVLPSDWPGHQAREGFLDVAQLLLPAARTYVCSALVEAGAPPIRRTS
ncbi:MAG: PaaX family transcriptional regulator [Actinobacteria bacterium]|nr:PaaX family transcriptional regulator [Actinomycetota bacterium]